MTEINGGGLQSKSILNNEQLDKATEETIQRVQGLSEGTTTTEEVIKKAFAVIGTAADINKKSLQELEAEYQRLNGFVSNTLIAVANQGAIFQNDPKQSGLGDPDYDKLLQEYATFEQKKQKIRDEYAEKRKKAEGDQELTEQLNKSEEKKIQKLSYDQLINSDDYIALFNNLDNLSVGKMIELRNNLESEWEKLNLSPEQLHTLRNKVGEATKVINEKNPFAALSDAIKGYISDERNVKIKDTAKSAEASFKLVKGSLDAVVSGITDIGLSDDKVTKELFGDISKMLGSAGDVAMGIASGNPSQMIQASINLLSSAFKVFNSGDRKADRLITEHAKNVENLEKSYSQLEKAIDGALGSGKYTATQEAIKNLEQQQEEIAKQADLERSKKKTDKDKVKEYEKALESAKNKQTELIKKLRNDIMSIDAKSAAQDLGNAFIEAFGKGENAVEAFGKKADNIVSNIIKSMLIQKLLEEPVGRILDQYAQRWYDDKGNFIGFDSVIKDADQMGKDLKGIGPGFADAMENLPDEIKKYFLGSEDSGSGGLTGAIKGASEETMNMAAGQLNAMRINQVEANEIMRGQLMHLSRISQNTSYNRYLKSIDERIERMEHKDSLRSQGLS